VFHPDPEQFFIGACKKSVFSYGQAGFRIEFKKAAEKSSGKSSEKSSGKTSGKMSGKILALIKENRYITIPELSEKIGVTERTIERNLQKLQDEHFLKRVGGAKGGHWEVISP
jgi:ATP-dependent DNA helicase RecG